MLTNKVIQKIACNNQALKFAKHFELIIINKVYFKYLLSRFVIRTIVTICGTRNKELNFPRR